MIKVEKGKMVIRKKWRRERNHVCAAKAAVDLFTRFNNSFKVFLPRAFIGLTSVALLTYSSRQLKHRAAGLRPTRLLSPQNNFLYKIPLMCEVSNSVSHHLNSFGAQHTRRVRAVQPCLQRQPRWLLSEADSTRSFAASQRRADVSSLSSRDRGRPDRCFPKGSKRA